jgi:hypothetical protein
MEEVLFSKTLLALYQTTLYVNPEENNVTVHCSKNLTSHTDNFELSGNILAYTFIIYFSL